MNNKKGLKKMQTNNTKAMSAGAKAIKALIKPKEGKPKIPRGSTRKLNLFTYIVHPKLGNVLMPTLPRVSGSAGIHWLILVCTLIKD